MDLVIRIHDLIEIERQILIRGVEDHAHNRARHFSLRADGANHLRLHFDRVGPGCFPKPLLLGRGGSHSLGAMKPPRPPAGRAQRRLQLRLVVQGEEDSGGRQPWSQPAGEPAANNQLRLLVRQRGAQGPFGIARAHAGEQDSDVGAPSRQLLERSGFFLHGKANDCQRHNESDGWLVTKQLI